MADEYHSIFVYGTLTNSEQVDAVLNDWRFAGPATLEGLHRVDGRYPTLAPGGRTEGRLLMTPELGPLDTYEGVDRGLYVRVRVPFEDSGAWVYVGDPARIAAPADWPGEGTFAARVRRHVGDAGVHVRRASNR